MLSLHVPSPDQPIPRTVRLTLTCDGSGHGFLPSPRSSPTSTIRPPDRCPVGMDGSAPPMVRGWGLAVRPRRWKVMNERPRRRPNGAHPPGYRVPPHATTAR